MHILHEDVEAAYHIVNWTLLLAQFGSCKLCTAPTKRLQSTVQNLREGLSVVGLHCLYKALAHHTAQAAVTGTKVKTLPLTAVTVLSGDHHEVQRGCETCHPLSH